MSALICVGLVIRLYSNEEVIGYYLLLYLFCYKTIKSIRKVIGSTKFIH